MNKTPIEWCRTYRPDGSFEEGYTVNPIRFRPHGSERTVTMCQKVSPGCKNCYAENITRRFWPKDALAKFPGYTAPGILSGDFVLDEEKLLRVLGHKKPCRIFWGDMTDLFQEGIPWDFLNKCFAVCGLTPYITHIFLTKRPEVMRQYIESIGNAARDDVWFLQRAADGFIDNCAALEDHAWPLPNVWLGTSVENQQYADERIPLLLQTPAAVRFISAEPLLGPVDLKHVFDATAPFGAGAFCNTLNGSYLELGIFSGPHIDWAITGGESGPGARPMHPDWARSLRDQCQAAGVPYFFKQWGEWTPHLPPNSGVPAGSVGPERVRWINADGRIAPVGNAGGLQLGPDNLTMRVGKKAAGALLDGREHREFPEVTHV